MKVRLGINPLTWTNDDMPELGAETPLETCLAEAEPHIALLTALGCTTMVHCEVTGSVHGQKATALCCRPILTRAQWDVLLPRLDEMARRLKARGLSMAYHHHMGTAIEAEDEVDRLMEGTSDVGLLLDTGHLTFAGGDPVRAAARHAARVVHVHCKDIRPAVMADVKARGLSFLDAVLEGVFTVPGDGCVDYPAVFANLPDYEGWLVVEAEQDPARAHPLTYARMGHDYLARIT